jgi:hypothetical protein
MIYKVFFDAKQINPHLEINPFGEYLPRIGDTLQWRIIQTAVGTTFGDTKWVATLKVDDVRFFIENDRDDRFMPKEIHISLSTIF